MSNTYQTIKFENGSILKVPSSWDPHAANAVAGLDEEGFPVASAGSGEDTWYFGLTMCCGASFKGLEDYVGCRSCYRPAEGNDLPYGEISKRV